MAPSDEDEEADEETGDEDDDGGDLGEEEEKYGDIRAGGGPNWLGGLLTLWFLILGPVLWYSGVIGWKTWLGVSVVWFLVMAFLGI